MRFAILGAVALAGTASAQIILPANPPAANNGGGVNWGLFFDYRQPLAT